MTNSILLWLLLIFWASGCVAQSQTAVGRTAEQNDLEKSVRRAFAEYEQTNNAALLLELPRTTEIIKYLEVYSESKKPTVREQVIGLAGQIKTVESVPLLVRGVADNERRLAEIASEILYKNYSRETLENNRDLELALSKSAINGNDSMAFYPLLSYFPTADNRKIIGESCRKITTGKNDLSYFNAQKSLAACIVSAGIGTEKGRRWTDKFRIGFTHSQHFMLDNLDLIDDPNALEILFQNSISDTKPLDDVFIEFGVRYPNPKYEPRFLDLAINKFAERLKINIGFKLAEEKRYGKSEIAVARRKILAEITRLKNKS